MATKKYEKVKLGLPAYITFAAFLVAIILMIVLVIPSNKKKVRKMFTGSYKESTSQQGQEEQVRYFEIEEDHILKTYSFKNLKKQIKKDKYQYIIFGDTTSTDFCLDVIKLNKLGKEMDIDKLIVVDTNKLSDSKKEYLASKVRSANSDVTSINTLPEFDIWVTKNNTVIDCYSNPDYENVNSATKLTMISRYHIFSYKN